MRPMQGPDMGGWRRELGSLLQFGALLLVLTVILLIPGAKGPGFLLSMFALVAATAGCLLWAVYGRRAAAARPLPPSSGEEAPRRCEPGRSGTGGSPEGSRAVPK